MRRVEELVCERNGGCGGGMGRVEEREGEEVRSHLCQWW